MSAGSYGTFTEQAALYGKQDAWDFMLAEGYAKSDGHRKNADGELKNALGKVGFQIDDHWRAEASFMYVDNYARDPNTSNYSYGIPKYTTEAGMLTASLSHHYDNLSGEIKVYVNQGEGVWYNSPSYGPATMYNKFDMDGIKLKEELSPWQGGHIRAGLDYDHLSGHLKGTYVPNELDLPDFYITSPYIAISQDLRINQEWSLVPSVGVRFYEHNVYASKSAPHAGLSLVSDKATIFANVSRGINYVGLDGPALQLWGALRNSGATSWRDLNPQELDHHEIGAKLKPIEGTQIDMSLFYDEVNNRYMYNGMGGYAYMTGGYHTKGTEVALKQNIGENWIGFASYSYLDPSNEGLPYMPKNSISVGLNGKLGDFKVAIDAQHQSKTYGLNSSRFNPYQTNATSPVNSFTVANVRVAYPVPQLGNKGELFLAIENLFDEKYEYVPGYTMPGINGQVGFVANF
jgi:iron complex outermembrane receptor protein